MVERLERWSGIGRVDLTYDVYTIYMTRVAALPYVDTRLEWQMTSMMRPHQGETLARNRGATRSEC